MKRAAVIGLGDISAVHLMAIEANPQITLCAVCDIDLANEVKAPEGVPFYQDYKEMAEQEKPDCVHICLPHYLHYPVAKDLVERGFSVFCEKPVALNTQQAEAFERLEAEHPEVMIGICLQNRRNETTEVLKELIDSGEYGAVTGISGMVPWCRPKAYYTQKPWRGRMETAGGGCMINQSVHTLDLLYFLGGSIKGVTASVSQLLDYGIEVEDTVTARLDFENGAKGMFFATIADYKNDSVQIEVALEKGDFQIRDNVLYQLLSDGQKKRLMEDKKMPGTKFYYGASHDRLIGEFYQALEQGKGPYIRVQDAKMSIRLIDAVQKSGKTGKYTEV